MPRWSRMRRIRGSPSVAPNSVSDIADRSGLVLPRASAGASLSMSKLTHTATLAPFGQLYGVSLRPARSGATACFNCASLQLMPGSAAGPRPASPGWGAGGCARARATAATTPTPATKRIRDVRVIDCMTFIRPPARSGVFGWTSMRTGRLLLDVGRHLLRGGEPDAGFRLHVGDELLVLGDARAV